MPLTSPNVYKRFEMNVTHGYISVTGFHVSVANQQRTKFVVSEVLTKLLN